MNQLFGLQHRGDRPPDRLTIGGGSCVSRGQTPCITGTDRLIDRNRFLIDYIYDAMEKFFRRVAVFSPSRRRKNSVEETLTLQALKG